MREKPIAQRSDSEIILMAAGQYQRSGERLVSEEGDLKNAQIHVDMAERCVKIAARLKRIDKR